MPPSPEPAREGVSVVATDVGAQAEWLAGSVGDRDRDVQGAVRSLPRAHLLLLRAALIGFDEAELASLIGVPRESVRPLLRVATAKLGSSLAEPADPEGS